MSNIERTKEQALELTSEQLDFRVAQSIGFDSPLLRGESSLYKKKWWDYRFLHPLAATYMFTACYCEAYMFVNLARNDMRAPDLNLVVRSHDGVYDPTAQKESVLNGLWMARRAADELGVPYLTFCCYGIDYSERADWKYLASPEQLTGEKILAYISDKWLARNISWIERPRDEFYLPENFSGHPYQIEWQEEFESFRKFTAGSSIT